MLSFQHRLVHEAEARDIHSCYPFSTMWCMKQTRDIHSCYPFSTIWCMKQSEGYSFMLSFQHHLVHETEAKDCHLALSSLLFSSILLYSILDCVLPQQEVALCQSPPSFFVSCYPCPYRSLLPHNVISPKTFWSSN